MTPLAAPVSVTLTVAARAVGAWCWLEERLFEILGRWSADAASTDIAPDEVALLLSEHSRHHAWRAERFAEVLPSTYVPERAQLVAAPADASLVDELTGFVTTADRLRAAYGHLLPLVASIYAESAAAMHPVTDRHLMRALRIVEADLRHDLEESRPLLVAHSGGISDPDPSSRMGLYSRKLQVRPTVTTGLGAALQRWGS